MAAVARWTWCPECGAVTHTTEDICEINGAGCITDEISEALAQHLLQCSRNAVKDDGILLRVGPIAIGRRRDHADRLQWFIKRYAKGQWRKTSYGATLMEAAQRATKKPKF